MTKKLSIALDYDNTYSADPEFWNMVITMAQTFGHDIRAVTARDIDQDRTQPLVELESRLQVIYTSGIAKEFFCTHFANGFVPDIWIDDKPESVLANSSASPERLETWRRERNEGASVPFVTG